MPSTPNVSASFRAVLRPFRARFVFVLFVFVLSAVMETLGIGAIMPFLSVVVGGETGQGAAASWFQDAFGTLSADERLLAVGSGLIAVYFLRSAVILLSEYQSARFTNELREYWSSRIFRNYLYGDALDLVKQKHGHFINAMVNEPIYAAKGIAAILDISVSALVSSSILAFLIFLNGKVTMVALGIIALGVGGLWRVSKRYAGAVGKERILLNQQISVLIAEAVGGIKQIKVFSIESRVLSEMKERLRVLMRKLNLFALVNASPRAAGEFLVVAVMVGALFAGRFLLRADLRSLLPEMGVFAVSFMKVFSLASLVLAKRMEIATYWPSVLLVHEAAAQEPRERHDPGATEGGLRRSLEAADLVFDFPDGARVLDRVSFSVSAGEIVGLAGRSGSGKSTICDLIAKLFAPTSGRLEADGVPLDSIGLSQWRSRIGYVSQDTFLFNASVADNIAIGAPQATRDRIEAAARMADADAFIRALPCGYETVVGSGGTGLSGGQRQRIALARAFLRAPDLLILDEATSALDAESEARIFESLRGKNVGMTVILVTHRLTTLRGVDRVIFLENGKIVEQGSFEALRVAGGAFQSLADTSGWDKGEAV